MQAERPAKLNLIPRKQKLGESEKSSNLLKRARANLLIEPAEACDGADLKACRDAAKDAAKQNGMPEREYGQVKRVAEIKGAAKEWAACSEVEPRMISATIWQRKSLWK